ncbi:MAG TPA: exodeoxyribonuclease VII large subunit [Candidatus Saccharimonadales bacterium]
MENVKLSVSDFIALTNQTLEYAYPFVEIEGEVASFKVNQGKYVFFDLKDAESTVGCFMMVFALRIPIEDGMKVIVRASPKLTKWGKFSLTVQSIRPSGEGSLKKSFELLKVKLEKEGLFASERKRILPSMPQTVAVISSTGAAGYADFMKIIDERWGGMQVEVAHVQVQGESAADQIIRAIRHFNEQPELADVLVVIRGGGSADDLSVFNDELLVRAIASSRIPTLTGIGHEIDESLADLAADVRASTPSNAAERLVPEKQEIQRHVRQSILRMAGAATSAIDQTAREVSIELERAAKAFEYRHEQILQKVSGLSGKLAAYDPARVLARGYSIVRGERKLGSEIEIESAREIIKAEVVYVEKK